MNKKDCYRNALANDLDTKTMLGCIVTLPQLFYSTCSYRGKMHLLEVCSYEFSPFIIEAWQ